MEKKPYAKTYRSGNTTMIVHSNLLKMSEEDAKQWVREQRAAGNPDLLALGRLVTEIYLENIRKELEKE
ncbi:hypothetical protein IFR10_09420 [Bacillus sp. CFBP 13597]|nr:hypothetical protein [Bacillus sp. CFBP 13597]